jgi:hypothetical protein
MMGVLLQCVLGSTCVALFAFAARQEREPEWLWGGASGAVWLITWLALGGGILLVLGGQVALYAAMAVLLGRRKARDGQVRP